MNNNQIPNKLEDYNDNDYNDNDYNDNDYNDIDYNDNDYNDNDCCFCYEGEGPCVGWTIGLILLFYWICFYFL